jgi:DNA-binding IclR family transcriptional regulator
MTPLLLSATGRVFAAFLPQRIVAPILADESAAVSAPPLEMSTGDVQAVLDEIRTHRLARALGNPIPGIHAFSAPVFDGGGQLALALTAMGPVGSVDPDWAGATASRVRAAADAIERQLGKPAD